MITQDEIYEIGYTAKTHGVKGELSFSFTKSNFDIEKLPYFIFNIDGLFVPFFIENYRNSTDTNALVKLEGINDGENARLITKHTAYIHNKFILEESKEEQGLSSFIGYTLVDLHLGPIGEITQVDQSTVNALFIIDKKQEELLIPATEDFIKLIDNKNKTIQMNLPEGLINTDMALEE